MNTISKSTCRRRFRPSHSVFDIFRCLLVACLGAGFSVHLSASEPSSFPAADAVTNADAVTPANPETPAAPRQRTFSQADLTQLLAAAFQQEYVKDKGELELRLTQPWTSISVSNEPLTLKILDAPATGVAPSFITRIELRAANAAIGTWQLPVQARVWRDIWVAKSALTRGVLIADAAIALERRDVLGIRDPLADFSAGDTTLILAEPLQTGSPLLARSVKCRPVVRRGQTADALVQDGVLSISMKVELLEDGVPGQTIRARNVQSRRDLRGRVLNEQTILVLL